MSNNAKSSGLDIVLDPVSQGYAHILWFDDWFVYDEDEGVVTAVESGERPMPKDGNRLTVLLLGNGTIVRREMSMLVFVKFETDEPDYVDRLFEQSPFKIGTLMRVGKRAVGVLAGWGTDDRGFYYRSVNESGHIAIFYIDEANVTFVDDTVNLSIATRARAQFEKRYSLKVGDFWPDETDEEARP